MATPNAATGDYRYAFQGQEQDPETGMEAFELRMWDGRLGRWLTVDPYGQYFSPYLGMGNNPISRIDPDGGLDGDPIKFPANPTKGQAFSTAEGGNWEYNGSKWIGKGFNPQDLQEVIIGGNSNIKAYDVARTLADFTPVGSILDITEGINDGDGWKVAMGVGFLVFDVATLGTGSLLKGTIKTAIKVGAKEIAKEGVEIGTKQLLLTAGKKTLPKHHVLPQQFRKWFAERGIKNIDDYTVKLSQKGHQNVHGAGQWNKKWKSFIDANPTASPNEIFHQVENMLNESGLQHLPYVKY